MVIALHPAIFITRIIITIVKLLIAVGIENAFEVAIKEPPTITMYIDQFTGTEHHIKKLIGMNITEIETIMGMVKDMEMIDRIVMGITMIIVAIIMTITTITTKTFAPPLQYGEGGFSCF